jgi:hypothetical protein
MDRILPFTPRILRAYPACADGLEGPEGLLLLALRWWVADMREARDPMLRLGQAMTLAGTADAAALSVDHLMRVIARTALRPVDMHPPHCRALSGDEQRLLHAARLAQRGEAEMAEATLRGRLLSSAGASFALGPLEGIGELFSAAGLMLRPRCLQEPDGSAAEIHAPWPAPLPAVRH